MLRIGFKTLYCGAVVSLISPTVLKAEDVAADQGTGLEEVVVTATRSETNLQQTAVAVTALSAGDLANRNVTSLLDVTNYVPSLSIGSRSGTSTANGSVSIRGMGVDAFASSAAVGIYVDDVYFASGGGNLLGLLDVDRVEVLRGPQGTLFGRNTIAGAIQYVTHQPEKEFGGYASATAGNYDRVDFEGALNVPLGETLALRIAGLSTDRDGFIRDLSTGERRGGDRTQAARLRARWTPTDRLTVDLKGEYVSERTDGRAVLVDQVNPNAQFVGLAQLFGETRPLNNSYLSPNRESFAGFNAPDYFDFDAYTAQAVINYQLSDAVNLKSITAYSSYSNELAQDFDNTPLSILAGVVSNDDNKVVTQELQLSGRTLSDRLAWTAGAYYFDSARRQNPGQAVALGFGPLVYPYGNPATDIDSTAAYGQATFDLTDRWSVTAGLRYSHETNESWVISATSPVKETFTDTSPHLGVNFQWNEDTMLYAKASKGFRAGGLVPTAALPSGGVAFDPETAWTYEAGARMEFIDGRLRLNPTIFYTDWQDIQFNVLIPTATTVVAATDNAGDARIKGFELESQFAVTDRLLLTGSMSLLDGEYTRVENLTRAIYPFGFLASFPNPATGQVLPGSTVILPNITLDTELQRAPKSKFSIGAQYTYRLVADSRLVANLDYAWTDEQRSAVTISDAVEMPAYGVLNARLQYEAAGGTWNVAVFGTNLTDEYYLVGGVDFAGGYTAGTRELDVARPREYGVELKVRF